MAEEHNVFDTNPSTVFSFSEDGKSVEIMGVQIKRRRDAGEFIKDMTEHEKDMYLLYILSCSDKVFDWAKDFSKEHRKIELYKKMTKQFYNEDGQKLPEEDN